MKRWCRNGILAAGGLALILVGGTVLAAGTSAVFGPRTRVVGRKIPIKLAFNHGVSFAFYFDDPDDHMIEVYWPTGAPDSYRQPYAEPRDLTRSDEVLLEDLSRGAV
jgi:hypothetical protein